MHAFSSYLGNRHRPPAVTNPQTGPITIHCAAKLSVECNDSTGCSHDSWQNRLLQCPHKYIIGHFGDESFQSITCTGTNNLTRTTKRQNTNNTTQKGALVNSTTDTQKLD